jgi:protein-disulfide isomerase
MKNPWIIVLVIAVVLIGGSVWYSGNVSEKNNEGVTFSPNVKGNAESAVTLVEYSDLQCPACAAFQPILNEVLTQYGDQIKFEYKHLPLPMHPFAEHAARAAEAAGQQGAFFAFHDKLFAEQAVWTRSGNPSASFLKFAEELGLDQEKFKRHMNASLVRDKVRAEAKEAREKGVTGTPTLFLNGTRMSFETYEDFKNQIVLAINPQVEFSVSGEEVKGEVVTEGVAPVAAPVTDTPSTKVQFGI